MQWLAEICVKRPVFATMLIFSLVVVGGFSFFSLGVDLFPKIDLPTVTITVTNPGSSPQEIESEITDKIESSVNTISGIDELRSVSVEGVSQVFVQFLLEKDVDVASQEVRDKVSLVVPDLPETADAPTVQKLDVDASPVLRIAVSAPTSLREVTDVADNQIQERIESINGVGQVSLIGGTEREIQILVNPDKMRAFNVSAVDVANAVRAQNSELPGGRIDEGTRELTVRTLGKLPTADEFNDIVVANRGNYSVKVKDIGYAEDGAEEQRSSARLNGQPAVTLIVSKQSGTNTVAVADAIKERLEEIQPTLPKGFKTQIVGDQSIFIKASLESIETHLIEGCILAAIIVFVFLWSFRSTIIAALAIPTSIIATFAVMYAMDFTLNQITMLSLTLMVGIVIDDAIVVLENIYRYIEEKGMSPFQAAVEGTREIGLAVLATTLSLIAVFLPIGFMGGIVGRFMSSFGLTSSAAILVSLLVSFTLTPMLAARLIKVKKKDEASVEDNVESSDSREFGGDETLAKNEKQTVKKKKSGDSKSAGFYAPIDWTYTKMLEFSMRFRWIVVGICVLVVISIVPLFSLVGKNFLPIDDKSEFEISVRAPEGYTLASTSTLLERIATDIRKIEGVSNTLTTIGGGQQEIVNSASMYIKLTDLGERTDDQQAIMVKVRELLADRYSKLNLRTSVQPISDVSGGGNRNADISYLITGPDLNKLSEYAEQVAQKAKSIPDAVDVDTSLINGKPELQLAIDRKRAGDLGVKVSDITQALNTLVAGQEVSTFNVGKDQYDVRVRALSNYRANIEGLKRMVVPTSKGGGSPSPSTNGGAIQNGSNAATPSDAAPAANYVSLDQVVKVTEGTGPSSIDRLNRQRQVTIYANVKAGGSQAAVLQQMEDIVKELKLEQGYTAGAAGRSKELARAGFYFLTAIVLSFIFMYIVLAAQFESFIHPITILLTLPLAIPFGILSLLIMGQTVNIFSGLGLLLLFGVVKKNAILQIDHTNQLRKQGMARYDAIIQANRDRLRPILMTTIALVAGMIPLIIGTGPGSATNRSVGVLVVGGQSLCLLLTLLAVPVFYSLFDDLGELKLFSRASRYSNNFFSWTRRKVSTAASSFLS
ncbi:MAG: efflux RND transporter permease subunit [Pyrinomonadaceae bacterium]|nr:efflux RND transporter permease subunit [Pyrinomonadaceae bacterium]